MLGYPGSLASGKITGTQDAAGQVRHPVPPDVGDGGVVEPEPASALGHQRTGSAEHVPEARHEVGRSDRPGRESRVLVDQGEGLRHAPEQDPVLGLEDLEFTIGISHGRMMTDPTDRSAPLHVMPTIRPARRGSPAGAGDPVAVTEGFEPSVACTTLAFEASSFGRSDTSPRATIPIREARAQIPCAAGARCRARQDRGRRAHGGRFSGGRRRSRRGRPSRVRP